MSSVVAGALAGCAAALLVSGGPAGRPPGHRPSVAVVASGLVALGGWWVATEPQTAALGGIVGGVAVAVARIVARHRSDRDAAWARRRVLEVCDGLHAELTAGQPPTDALARMAVEWPVLAPVSRTAVVGGDVPAAFRDLASSPGAGDLRVVGAAWQVAHRTGHGLADALARVAAELREADQVRRVVAGELASARATARLVAGLPLVVLAMGSGAGADPWRFLLGGPFGLACLGGGLACGVAGLAWIEALARDVERGR